MSQSTPPAYKQLTDEIEPEANGRSLLITLLATLILLLLINAASIWYLDKYPNNRGYWLVKAKWERLQAMEEPVDWLIVGDSSANQGIRPTDLTAELDGSAINLATVASMGAVDDVWMLQTYIQQFGPPPNVIVVHTTDAWHRQLQMVFIGKSTMPWSAWNDLQPDLNLTFQQQLDIFLARYVPIYADNRSLSNVIMDTVIEGKPFFISKYSLDPHGFMAQQRAARSRVRKEAFELIQFAKNGQFVMSETNQQAVNQLVTLADTYAIQLYFVPGPLYEGLMEDEAFQDYFTQVQTTLLQLSQGSDHVHVIDRPITFPANEMENPDHIIERAVERYTRYIAAAIQDITTQNQTP